MPGFVSFLKKLGQILTTATTVAIGVGPILFPKRDEVGQTINILEQVTDIVIKTEAMGVALGLTGAQKLQAAVAAAMELFKSSSILHGQKVQDEVMFREGVTSAVESVVKVLNSLKADISTDDIKA